MNQDNSQVKNETEIVQLTINYIAEWPDGRIYELLSALWRLGIDVFNLVPNALNEVASD